MNKISILAIATLFSGGAFAASFGDEVGIGYHTSSIDTNYGECWAECYGDNEPSGYAIEGRLTFGSLFATADYATTEDKENTYSSEITSSMDERSFGLGYAYALTRTSTVSLAAVHTSVDWEYAWTTPAAVTWAYKASDHGFSVVIGAETLVSSKIKAGASISRGFANGIKAYTQFSLTEMAAVKVAFANTSYESDFDYTINNVSQGFGTDYGDAPMEFDNQTFRVSAMLQF